MSMIPRSKRGLLVALAALSGVSSGTMAQQPDSEAPTPPAAQQAPPPQLPPPQQQAPAPQSPQPQAPAPQSSAPAQPAPAPQASIPAQQPPAAQSSAPAQPAPAPQQSGAPESPTRLGRPFPAPVVPPPRKEEPNVYVTIVPPQESSVTKGRLGGRRSLRNGASAPNSTPDNGGGTDSGLGHPAGNSSFGQPPE
jgi:hypothetical protein